LYKYFDQDNYVWDDKEATLKDLKFLINKFLDEKNKSEEKYFLGKEKNIKLHSSTLDSQSIFACLESMLEGKITLGSGNFEYEKNLSKYFQVNNAITVNSGSSANLLAIFGLIESGKLSKNDRVIVPALSWSTTVFPLSQAGLVPVFCDQSEHDFNVNLDQVEEQAKRDDVKALMLIHTYGLASNMDRVMDICNKYELTLIEDTCESMGAMWGGSYCGSFGIVSTFSTYFSHHICTLEGGILLTDNSSLDQIYRSMRSHGWARGFPKESDIFAKYSNHDPSFLFPHTGFNIRISEPQSRIGIEQLKKLPSILDKRIKAGKEYIDRIEKIAQLETYSISPKARCVFFGLPLLLPEGYDYKKTLHLRHELRANGVETRPFLCGDFTNQPALKKINYEKPYKCSFAENLHQRSIALPCHQDIGTQDIERIFNLLTKFL
tara:strand:- start:4711 stop:6015 length:1305 start_codon:yes stop_codon:yes gene_type:complete